MFLSLCTLFCYHFTIVQITVLVVWLLLLIAINSYDFRNSCIWFRNFKVRRFGGLLLRDIFTAFSDNPAIDTKR